MSDETGSDPGAGDVRARQHGAASGGRTALDPEVVASYLQWGVLVALSLFALYAAAGLYGNLTRLVVLWVVPEYRPVVAAGINAAVVLVCVLGVSVLLRRLRAD